MVTAAAIGGIIRAHNALMHVKPPCTAALAHLTTTQHASNLNSIESFMYVSCWCKISHGGF
jgi:hypothetical protein